MPVVDLGADVTLCSGEDVVLDATWPGATYLWNTGAITPTLTATTTGNYSVTVSLNGCVANDAINVNVLSATSWTFGLDACFTLVPANKWCSMQPPQVRPTSGALVQ
ncbi:MAG: hypothetical protein IPO56_17595 [Flavobacteriales bacterium]|nr:hypothetical protein [Flavobacteriales bacterium]